MPIFFSSRYFSSSLYDIRVRSVFFSCILMQKLVIQTGWHMPNRHGSDGSKCTRKRVLWKNWKEKQASNIVSSYGPFFFCLFLYNFASYMDIISYLVMQMLFLLCSKGRRRRMTHRLLYLWMMRRWLLCQYKFSHLIAYI